MQGRGVASIYERLTRIRIVSHGQGRLAPKVGGTLSPA